jgi:hypothetical protein
MVFFSKFYSYLIKQSCGAIWLAQFPDKEEVDGSNPFKTTKS